MLCKNNSTPETHTRNFEPKDSFEKMFHVDLRSLAAYRISISLVILVDVLFRFLDLNAHYAESGVLPVDIGMNLPHFLEGFFKPLFSSVFFHASAFLLTMVFAVTFCLGFFSRVSNIVLFILFSLIHARNGLVLQNGDVVLTMLLFWSIFTPTGARASIDSLKNPSMRISKYFSLGCMAFMLQMAIMYVEAALLKNPINWRVNGTAIETVLHLEQFTTPFAIYIRDLIPSSVWSELTKAVWYVELLAPFLLFSPILNQKARFAGFALLASLHLGFVGFMFLGGFPYICLAGLMMYVPSDVWSFLARRQGRVLAFRGNIERIATRIAKLEVGVPAPFFELTSAGNFVAVSGLTFTLLWITMDAKREQAPDSLRTIGKVTGLSHSWGMFKEPYNISHRLVVKGFTISGNPVDVNQYKNAPPEWENSHNTALTVYKRQRWRKYLENIYHTKDNKLLASYGAYLCRSWNSRQAEPLKNLHVFFNSKKYQPGVGYAKAKRTLKWSHDCRDIGGDVSDDALAGH